MGPAQPLPEAGGGDLRSEPVRRRRGVDQPLDAVIRTAHADVPDVEVVIEEERGSSGKLLIEQVSRSIPSHTVTALKLIGDKITRSYGLAAAVGAGRVTVVEQEWTPGLVSELANFPTGGYDDQVDAAVHGFNHLEATRPPVYAKASIWRPA